MSNKKTGHDLKVWLVKNKLRQADLIELLGVTGRTANTYCNSSSLSKIVVMAINSLNKGDL